MDDVGGWFKSLPIFTRYWFGGTVALSLIARFGLISPYYLILHYEETFSNYQVTDDGRKAKLFVSLISVFNWCFINFDFLDMAFSHVPILLPDKPANGVPLPNQFVLFS